MRFVLALVLGLPAFASAQFNWADAGMPGRSLGVRQLYVDPLENTLYVLGIITEGGTDIGNQIVMRYNGSTWDSTLVFQGHPYTAIRYGDTLIIGGNNLVIGGLQPSCTVAYYDGEWHSYGEFSNGLCRKLRVIDGELYAIGGFDFADGNYCNGIARRVNGQWVNVGFLESEFSDGANLTDIAKYEGDLYVCGGLNMMPNGENAVARFDGSSWTSPGGGVLGGVAAGRCLTVYDGELYMGGSIYQSAGNAGHMIMRWNGSEWNGVGGSFQDQWGTTEGAARCYALFEHEGKLLAGGGFFYAGGIPANKFAIWDGERWCGTEDTMSGEGESFAVYNDTLYMASGTVVNGDSTNRVIKWIGGPVEGGECSEPVGVVEEIPSSGELIHVRDSRWIIEGLEQRQQYRLHIFDIKGSLILERRVSNSFEMDLASYGPGIYVVRIMSASSVFTGRIMKQE